MALIRWFSPPCRPRAAINHSLVQRRTLGLTPSLSAPNHPRLLSRYQPKDMTDPIKSTRQPRSKDHAPWTPKADHVWQRVPGGIAYADLIKLRRTVRSSVVVAIDMRWVHHTKPREKSLEWSLDTLSEVGIAWLDMRGVDRMLRQGPLTAVASKIKASHFIDRRWADVTQHTCPRCRTETTTGSHAPYDCIFATTRIWSRAKMMSRVKKNLEELSLRSSQIVYVLFWSSAGQSIDTLKTSGAYPEPNEQFVMWDLARWHPISYRRNLARRHQPEPGRHRLTPAYTFANNVGLGMVTENHPNNAANDAWAYLMGFVRCLAMTKPFFDKWVKHEFDQRPQLEPLDETWLDKGILKMNQSLDPTLPDLEAARTRLRADRYSLHQFLRERPLRRARGGTERGCIRFGLSLDESYMVAVEHGGKYAEP